MLTLTLVAVSLLSCSFLAVSVARNIEYMEKFEELEESLQVTIDLLEMQYQIIDQKTKVEVFSDEPLIRELVKDIATAKNAVLVSAKILDESINVDSLDNTEEIMDRDDKNEKND
jgi:hypothetical protein